MRSSGSFVDRSSWCAPRGLTGTTLARCQQLLSRVPSELISMNKGLTTLQFQSLSVSPFNPQLLQGGTQDNGTWQTEGNPVVWENTMIGDGGQSGFDAANPAFRFHSFFDATPEVNFNNGATADWISVYDPIFGTGGQFYSPIIGDPTVCGHDVRGCRQRLAHEDTRPRNDDHGRGATALQQLDRRLRRHVWRLAADRFAVADECGVGRSGRRFGGGGRAPFERQHHRLGSDDHGSALHLEERQR